MFDGEETRRLIGRITRAQTSDEVWAHTDCLVIGVEQLATANSALREEVAEVRADLAATNKSFLGQTRTYEKAMADAERELGALREEVAALKARIEPVDPESFALCRAAKERVNPFTYEDRPIWECVMPLSGQQVAALEGNKWAAFGDGQLRLFQLYYLGDLNAEIRGEQDRR